jgi:hypothetical protein
LVKRRRFGTTYQPHLNQPTLRNNPEDRKNSAYHLMMGYAVAQLVEALRYELEGRRFDSLWGHWNFSVT